MDAEKIKPKSISHREHREHREHRVGVGAEIFRLRVTLLDCKPAIWREIEAASSTTLASLHDVLQILMGWEDYHLWAFEVGSRRFELPDPDAMRLSDKPPENPGRVTLSDLFAKKGQKFGYHYDFGDDWHVELTVVAIGKPARDFRYPRCVGGECAGPPEDCGGPPGFGEILAARRNPKSARAGELLEWIGPDWDPEAFNLAVVNKALAALPAPRRLH